MDLSTQIIAQVAAVLTIGAFLWMAKKMVQLRDLVSNGIHDNVKGLRDEFRTYKDEQRERWGKLEEERFLTAARLEKIEKQIEWTEPKEHR